MSCWMIPEARGQSFQAQEVLFLDLELELEEFENDLSGIQGSGSTKA